MIKNIFSSLRAAFDSFVKKHIVDDEENLWPDLVAAERDGRFAQRSKVA